MRSNKIDALEALPKAENISHSFLDDQNNSKGTFTDTQRAPLINPMKSDY